MAELPDKLYYTIREVAEHCGVEPHVLRYWETEFPLLRPRRTRSGSRAYRRRDIELIAEIKELLYEQGYRIEGARRVLRERHRRSPQPPRQQSLPFAELGHADRLDRIREEVREILELLREMAPPGVTGTATPDGVQPSRER